MKRIVIEIVVVVVLLSLLFGMWKMFTRQRNERIRLEKNQNALLQDVVRFKTSDSLNVLQVEQLTLTKNEFKKYNELQKETIDKLNIKIRRLESASSTAVVTKTVVETIVKDSIIEREGQRDTLRCISFDDGWVSVNGCADGNNIVGTIISRDTIETYADRIPKFEWWFIRLGTKAIRQTVMAKNPHSVIEYNRTVEIKRGR